MPDREKLIELLGADVCKHDCCDDCEYGQNRDACIAFLKESMADHIISNGVTVQHWIPVSEPPKEPGEYNVAQKHWLDGHLESKRGKWNGVEWFVDGKESLMVTHWMPLPQPPKE